MKLFLILALVSTASFAAEKQLSCTATHNYQTALDTEVSISLGQKNLSLGVVDRFEILISSLDKDVIELQAYDAMEPSRTYSTAALRSVEDEVKLSIWTREFIVDVLCKLVKKKR